MWVFLLVNAVLGVLGSEDTPLGDPQQQQQQQQLQALHCPPCERIHCSTRQALRLQCKGGVTTGVCGCCPVCAKTEGESCGGTWDYLGKCDEGLVCVYQDTAADKSELTGICKAVIEPLDPESCYPECTKAYCHANPSKICSAKFVSLEKKACQGSCQHTSCSSCLLLRPPPCSQSCASSDPSCLHRFGKCVHNRLLAPLSPVCHHEIQVNSEGFFMCLVPSCPH